MAGDAGGKRGVEQRTRGPPRPRARAQEGARAEAAADELAHPAARLLDRVAAHARQHTAPLRQLLYPLVQVTTGVARLLPNIRFAPLRFQ